MKLQAGMPDFNQSMEMSDVLVDQYGNPKTDEQSRQLRQALIGTTATGREVSGSQRQKAADEFIAGIENWEPLTDQRTYEDIPEVRGGIVDGQWDANYQVAPEAKTETTNQIVSDVGTVNEFGEVVGPLGVQDGDQIAATYGGNTPKPDMWDQIIKKIETHTPVKGSDDYPYYGRPGSGMGDRWKGSSLPGGDEVAQVASAGDLSGLGIGATNQPATVDLNKSDELPPSPTADDFLEEYIPPSQPYDQQEPVGNYIKNEETGLITQIYDAPIPGVLPSQQEIAGDWTYVSTYRPSSQLQSLWRANEAAIQRQNREWNQGNPVVGFDLGAGMRAGEKASKAFSDLQTKESAAHQKLTPEQGGNYWAAPGESYNVPWGGFPKGTTHWVFQNNN
jgi:hypothetical protein